MEWLDKKELLTALIGATGGYLLSFIAGVSKLKHELAFIKGQLSQLVKIHGDVSEVKENQSLALRDQQKIRKDLDAAHVAIREVRSNITKG